MSSFYATIETIDGKLMPVSRITDWGSVSPRELAEIIREHIFHANTDHDHDTPIDPLMFAFDLTAISFKTIADTDAPLRFFGYVTFLDDQQEMINDMHFQAKLIRTYRPEGHDFNMAPFLIYHVEED